uniref:Uncharacterized protein n=1 Tax=Picea glauca TaxID=3330 RepID=A0A101LY24_PICGL|nr:hypothetical protein ABT39_MTgene5493 [Picea glauca]
MGASLYGWKINASKITYIYGWGCASSPYSRARLTLPWHSQVS